MRGRPILCAILDEIAFWRDDTSATPDVETYKALKPATATMPGAMIVGISSPYRKSGLLYDKFKNHYGKPGKVLVIRAPTALLNPTIDPEIIAEALAEDPAAARAEWLAEFRDDIGGWADQALIEGAVEYGITVRPPREGVTYHSFCDPSGGARDSFTAAVAHKEDGVAVLDCVIEVKAPFNPTEATEQISWVLKSYDLTTTIGDKYAAQWVVEAFAKNGIRYDHSERDRSSIYLDVLPMFTSGQVKLLDNKRLVNPVRLARASNIDDGPRQSRSRPGRTRRSLQFRGRCVGRRSKSNGRLRHQHELGLGETEDASTHAGRGHVRHAN